MKETAAGLASLGRGPDSMLVHMSPREVAGLQSLALAHGGSLTTNPHTGLPEAGFLDSILPTVLGVAGSVMFPAAAPWMIGAGVGGLQALRTGDLGKGLMAGLGAFGGAGLGGALGSMGGAGAGAAEAGLGTALEAGALNPAMVEAGTSGLAGAAMEAGALNPALAEAGAATGSMAPSMADRFAAAGRGVGAAFENPAQFGSTLMDQYGGKVGAAAAGIGALGALGGLEQEQLEFGAAPQQRSNARLSGPVRRPYDESAPGGYYFTDRGTIQPSYASGGITTSVPALEDGGFVLTKKAVDGIGKGSNERGQLRAAAGLGAIPIRGPGTGTSDSIPTSIDGDKPALVSNGEAYVPKREVQKRGGAKKFYALMRKAEKAAHRA